LQQGLQGADAAVDEAVVTAARGED
jgi:hypothetical protein